MSVPKEPANPSLYPARCRHKAPAITALQVKHWLRLTAKGAAEIERFEGVLTHSVVERPLPRPSEGAGGSSLLNQALYSQRLYPWAPLDVRQMDIVL